MNIFLFCVLSLNLGTSFLSVWLFYMLLAGRKIVPDSMTQIELILASFILGLTVLAWGWILARIFKQESNKEGRDTEQLRRARGGISPVKTDTYKKLI